jgi:hypothetical protein
LNKLLPLELLGALYELETSQNAKKEHDKIRQSEIGFYRKIIGLFATKNNNLYTTLSNKLEELFQNYPRVLKFIKAGLAFIVGFINWHKLKMSL